MFPILAPPLKASPPVLLTDILKPCFVAGLAPYANPQVSPTVEPNTSGATDSSYTFILHNRSVANMTVQTAAGGSVGASTPFFLGEDDAPNSKTVVAKSVRIGVIAVQNNASTQLTVVGNDTGATNSITITNNVTVQSLVFTFGAGAGL